MGTKIFDLMTLILKFDLQHLCKFYVHVNVVTYKRIISVLEMLTYCTVDNWNIIKISIVDEQ